MKLSPRIVSVFAVSNCLFQGQPQWTLKSWYFRWWEVVVSPDPLAAFLWGRQQWQTLTAHLEGRRTRGQRWFQHSHSHIWPALTKGSQSVSLVILSYRYQQQVQPRRFQLTSVSKLCITPKWIYGLLKSGGSRVDIYRKWTWKDWHCCNQCRLFSFEMVF